MRRAVLAIGFGSAMAFPVNAADPALLNEGAKAVEICAQTMPDIRKTKVALKDAGFRLDDSNGKMHAYTRNGARVVVAVTTPSAERPACMAVVSKMTPAEAKALLQPWIAAAQAKPVQDNRDDYSFTHVGVFKGGPVMLGVIDHTELKIVRGAAVIAVGLNKQ